MSEPRWFAVVCANGKTGYALDYYPNEKRTSKREMGSMIIGDFTTREQALAAVRRLLFIRSELKVLT